jgi:hypothetical protein
MIKIFFDVDINIVIIYVIFGFTQDKTLKKYLPLKPFIEFF